MLSRHWVIEVGAMDYRAAFAKQLGQERASAEFLSDTLW